MARSRPMKHLGLAVTLAACTAFAADTQKQFRYTAAPGATLNVVGDSGSIAVHPSSGRQVVIVATLHSDKTEVDSSQKGNRIEVQTRFAGKPEASDAKVDYDIQVPADIMLSIRADEGPVRIEKLRGEVTVEADDGDIGISDCSGARIHVRSVKGPVTLSRLSNATVDVTNVGGDVHLDSVSGRKVTINTTKGNIRYAGDFGGGGDYLLNTHSGAIDVALPASASVDMTAHSINGSVEQDFPFQPKPAAGSQATPGRSFAGTSNSGASSVQLRSFSGKIRVKKQ